MRPVSAESGPYTEPAEPQVSRVFASRYAEIRRRPPEEEGDLDPSWFSMGD